MLNLLYSNAEYETLIEQSNHLLKCSRVFVIVIIIIELLLLCLHITATVLGVRLAKKKGKDAGVWGFLCFSFGFIALLVLAHSNHTAQSTTKNTTAKTTVWKCFKCGKTNPSACKKCYNCGAERKAIQPSTNTKKTAIAWKCSKCGELNNPNAKNCINCFTEKPNS